MGDAVRLSGHNPRDELLIFNIDDMFLLCFSILKGLRITICLHGFFFVLQFAQISIQQIQSLGPALGERLQPRVQFLQRFGEISDTGI